MGWQFRRMDTVFLYFSCVKFSRCQSTVPVQIPVGWEYHFRRCIHWWFQDSARTDYRFKFECCSFSVGNKPENTVDTIRIRVRNLGMTDIHQFTLSYGVSGEIPRTLNWNGTLQPAENWCCRWHIFVQNIRFRPELSYQTLNDLDHSNDSCTIHLFGVPLIVPPFANSHGKYSEFLYSKREFRMGMGKTNSSIINSAFDGSNCWKNKSKWRLQQQDEMHICIHLYLISVTPIIRYWNSIIG